MITRPLPQISTAKAQEPPMRSDHQFKSHSKCVRDQSQCPGHTFRWSPVANHRSYRATISPGFCNSAALILFL